tara:strand:- start:125 stop:430 length:306 start_codon:yes stop_codon:yes gene_type:complete
MNQYRLHIDIPLGTDEAEAIANAKSIMEWHFIDKEAREKIQTLTYDRTPLTEINYRLGHDDDRQRSNYLHINENGHVNNKKSKIMFLDSCPSNQTEFEWSE